MSRQAVLLVLAMAVVLVLPAPVSAGGWSVATLDHFPGQIVAQMPVTLGFVVRQHGVNPIENLAPTIDATHVDSGETLTVTAEPEGETGHYVATLTFLSPGAWSWSINAFGPIQTMPPLTVLALEDVGATLFVAKGCAMCHEHRALTIDPVATINAGPDLTDLSAEPAYLRRWLRDPSEVISYAQMPALGLNDEEIEALVAFLGQGDF